jgi:UDPglucose 6-dehydrogenase
MHELNNKIGIIGNGFVGNALYEGMRHTNECHVYDINKDRSLSTLEQVTGCSFIFICVPTPQGDDGRVVMDYVYNAINSLQEYDINNSVLIIKSTVEPGTCNYLQKKYHVPVISNPEFLTERTACHDFKFPRCIVIGGDEEPRNALKSLYENSIFPSVSNTGPMFRYYLTDSTTSELIKYTTNCFFSVKIGFMNEMKQICDTAGGNWSELVEGFVYEGRVFPQHLDVPGHDGLPGFGGKCFPKDLSAIIEYAKAHDIDPKIMKGASDKNKELRGELV